LAKERGSVFLHRVIPILGAIANVAMLLAVVWLGILGGGDTQSAAFFGLAATGVWALIGVVYFVVNSRTTPSAYYPPGKEPQFK